MQGHRVIVECYWASDVTVRLHGVHFSSNYGCFPEIYVLSSVVSNQFYVFI